jgi:Mg2+/Co2+ transporter CorB
MIDLDAGINELREKLQQSHHTRVVVYQGTIDNILGYVHTKDVLTLTCGAYSKHELSLLIRKINFIPDFILIVKQLRMAQNKRERLFMVVNEYGDLLGLACLEDMLEIVFGDFTTDAPHRNYLMIKEDNGSFIVDGATLVREFNEAYQLDLPFSYDAMSINGLIMKQLSTIPVCGVCFRLGNISFEVLQVGKFWAERVRISSIQSR